AVIGVFRLLPGILVLDQGPFKGGDVIPAKDGGVAAAPQEPEEIAAPAPLLLVGGKVALAGQLIGKVQERPALEGVAVEGEGLKFPILCTGHAAVEQQVAVMPAVEGAGAV